MYILYIEIMQCLIKMCTTAKTDPLPLAGLISTKTFEGVSDYKSKDTFEKRNTKQA